MDKTIALTHCADALKMFGRYETGSDTNFLPMKMLFAFQEICKRKPWSWKRATATITTTQGVNGGYALPVDFDLLTVLEETPSTYTDSVATFPRLLDSSGKSVDCVLRRSDNTLYFKNDPNNATYTLSYIPKFSTLDQITMVPDDMLDIVCELTKSFALGDDENTAGMSDRYLGSFERKMEKYWIAQRKGTTMQSARVPVGELGIRFDHVLKYDVGLS